MCRVWCVGCGVGYGVVCRVSCVMCRVWCVGCGLEGVMCRV